MFTITTGNLKRRLGEGASMPNSKVQRIMSTLPDRMRPKSVGPPEKSPDMTVQELQKQHTKTDIVTPSYNDLTDFFHAPTQAEIDAYQHDILAAVRSSKVDTLRGFHKQGRPMKCSNEFGESILHLACRKGLTEVAKFLVEEAGVPVQVCDDYGRNPLHDACWVHKPNFELMDLVLSKCPDLLYIKDRRGHTPLSFARRDQWKCWNDYVSKKTPEFLAPKELLKRQLQNGVTNTSIAAPTAPSKTVPKRPGVAATGIRIPTFTANVAATGIKIPVSNSVINLAASAAIKLSKAIPAVGASNTNAVFPTNPKLSSANAAAVAASGINVLLQASKFPANPASPMPANPTAPAATAG